MVCRRPWKGSANRSGTSIGKTAVFASGFDANRRRGIEDFAAPGVRAKRGGEERCLKIPDGRLLSGRNC